MRRRRLDLSRRSVLLARPPSCVSRTSARARSPALVEPAWSTTCSSARGLHIAALMRCKFILARKVREKIAAASSPRTEQGVRLPAASCLRAGRPRLSVSFDDAFAFAGRDVPWTSVAIVVPGSRRRHFLGSDQVPAFDGAEPDGEEFRCARRRSTVVIDREVLASGTWRNIPSRSGCRP